MTFNFASLMTVIGRTIEFPVVAGMCRLEFQAGITTGPGEDTRPGVGFMLIGEAAAIERGGKFYSGIGVIGRQDAKRLRDLLDAFLAEFPASEAEAGG